MRIEAVLLCALLATGCRQVLGLDDLECRPVYAAAVDYGTDSGPRAITIADINVDNRLDVISANNTNANISRFLGNGDGTVMAKSDHGAIGGAVDIASGDVTGDGITDILVLSGTSLLVMRGDGNDAGGLTPDPGIPVTLGRDLDVGDFNRDGTQDVVVVADTDAAGHAFVQLAQNDGTLSAAVDYGGPVGASVVRVGDFNGDRRLDLLVVEKTGERPLVMLPGNGDGTFGERVDSENPVAVLTLVTGDVNNDDAADVVIGSSDQTLTTITVMLANGDGTFRAGTPLPQPMPLFPHALVDMNGDTLLDIVGEVNAIGAGVMLGEGNGTFGAITMYETSSDPIFVTAANLDDDEVPELIALLNATSRIAIVDGSCAYASP